MKRLLIALALLIGVAGAGYASGTEIGKQASPLVTHNAAATCTIAIGAPLWHNGAYRGSMSASGCGSITLQACMQNTAGTVYACTTWSGVGANVFVWSGAANLAYCQQRTWGWSSVYGTWVSAWRILC